MDYSQDFLDLEKLLRQYRDLMNERNFDKAFQVGLKMIVHSRMLKIIAQDLAE